MPTASPTQIVVSGTQRSEAVRGLEPGTYEVIIQAENAAGWGPASPAETATLLVDGGSGRIVAIVPSGSGAAAPGSGMVLSHLFAGLDVGTFEVEVEAENAVGWGPASAAEAFQITDAEEEPTERFVLLDATLLEADLSAVSLPPSTPELGRSLRSLRRTREAGASVRDALVLDLVGSWHPLAPELFEDRVVRLRWVRVDNGGVGNARHEYWRIERVSDGLRGAGPAFTATCRRIEGDLADTVAVYTTAEGRRDPYVSIYDLEVSEALQMILTEFGVPGRRRQGAVPFLPTTAQDSITGERVTFAAEGASHLDLLRMLAEAAGGRLRFDHRPGAVWVSVIPLPAYDAATPAVATIGARHQFDLVRGTDAGPLVTTLVPLGGPEGGAFTVGRLRWELVGVVSPTRLIFSTPGGSGGSGYPGRRSPVWADGALVGSYLTDDDGRTMEVVETYAPNVVVVDGSVPIDFSDLGTTWRFATDAGGTELIALETPAPEGAPATSAVNERTRRYEDAAPVPNLLERNAVAADFYAATGWATLGAATTARETARGGPSVGRGFGRHALRVTAAEVRAGIESPLMWLTLEDGPYASAWLALERASGSWIVELVDGAGQVFGSADDEAGWIDGSEEAYALGGMEVRAEPVLGPEAPNRRVKLRIRCTELPAGGPAELILDAACVTQSAVEYEYRPGLGPHEVWFRAANELARAAKAPREEYRGEIVDPRVLAGLAGLEVEDVVELETPRGPGGPGDPPTVKLPISRIEEELAVGSPSHVLSVAVGAPEPDASRVGAALGLEARSGSARWNEAQELPTRDPRPPRRERAVRRYG